VFFFFSTLGGRKGVRKGGFWVSTHSLNLIFYKTLLPAQRRLIVFAYFFHVNLLINCQCHEMNLRANFKQRCKLAEKL